MDGREDVLGTERKGWLYRGILLCGYPVVEHEQAARIEHGADQGLSAKALLDHHRHLVADGIPGTLDTVERPALLFHAIVVGELGVQNVEKELVDGAQILVELAHVMLPAGTFLGR